MNILRDNRNSVMAMLEAFVYDPLISWRLLAQDTDGPSSVSASVNNVVEKAVQSSIAAASPVGSPVTERDLETETSRTELEGGESRGMKDEPRENLPKLLRLKSSAIESSQETLNTRYYFFLFYSS
jgi:phosphatidylinositol kinase/protein kinase (PI-3  family)